jgi:hypothetical protein
MKSIAARYDGRPASGRVQPAPGCSSISVSVAATQLVNVLMQKLYLKLRLYVYPIVVLRDLAINFLLPVLAHHYFHDFTPCERRPTSRAAA